MPLLPRRRTTPAQTPEPVNPITGRPYGVPAPEEFQQVHSPGDAWKLYGPGERLRQLKPGPGEQGGRPLTAEERAERALNGGRS